MNQGPETIKSLVWSGVGAAVRDESAAFLELVFPSADKPRMQTSFKNQHDFHQIWIPCQEASINRTLKPAEAVRTCSCIQLGNIPQRWPMFSPASAFLAQGRALLA